MSRGRTLGALVAVYALLLAIQWDAGARLGVERSLDTWLGLAVAAIVAVVWWRNGVGLDALGLAPARFGRGWSVAIGVSLFGASLLLAVGVALGSVSLGAARFRWLADYAPGIVGQQLLLQGFFAPGIRKSIGARGDALALAITALAFAGLHAPNPALLTGTLGAGLFWLWLFGRDRNLLAVLASHLLLGVAAMVSLGPGPLLNLRVGEGALDLLRR